MFYKNFYKLNFLLRKKIFNFAKNCPGGGIGRRATLRG